MNYPRPLFFLFFLRRCCVGHWLFPIFSALGVLAIGIVVPAAQAYDVMKVILVPNLENDPPARTIAKIAKGEVREDGTQEFEEKVFLPRNDKLQRFDFAAEGKFTGRDIDNRNATNLMPVEANFVDVQTDGASIALTVLFGGPGRTRRAITMSTFQGEVPMPPDAKEGDIWQLAGTFQVGCTTDGRVFGSTGPRISRFSGAIEFPGDRTFKVFRIECEESPKPAAS
ncbi:MAG: hypothetical protein NW220_21215 [Leptolyngbyaceae cyanobacterium bins.349]|nr:hypothetical protein [Leptolyngbyaceae cyanobacterium bins.349]